MIGEVYAGIYDTRKDIRSLKRQLREVRKAKRELFKLQKQRDRLEKSLKLERGDDSFGSQYFP